MSSRDSIDRRRILSAALGAAAAARLGWLRPAQAQTNEPAIATTPLRGGAELVTGLGSNAVLLRGAESGVLIDSGPPETARALRAHLGALPIDTIFNTHWRPTHTGGNETVRAASTTIVAHELTRLWMSTEYYVDWEDRTYTPRAAAALPTRTFYASDPQPIALAFGDETIEYGHLPEAHTDGDIYVLLKNRNVIVTGGVVTVGAYPVIDYATGGWIGGLVDATKKLLAITNADSLVVPKDGAAQPRSHLQAQLEMLTVVRERIENLMRKGKSIEEMLAADVTAGFDAAWGTNRERFVANIYNGLWWAGRLGDSL
jgi:glyoxylase-like metal-dependent hydrolase (beta-lactamase superfamily II)